tara:strand:+ start:1505 stop:2212 length:708 start_codon:yes stop_codon:yes gene_type:complete
MIIRATILGLLFLSVAACSNSQDLLNRGVALVVNDKTTAVSPAGQFPPRFAALVADTSVPAMIMTVERRSQSGRLLREAKVNGIETWVSSDLTAVMLENGMLQGTRGLGSELFAAELSEPMALILSGKTGYSSRLHSNLKGDNRIVTRTFNCLVEASGTEAVTLEIGTIPTRIMTEDCKSLDQAFRNTYWVSRKGGTIVQARQWAGDEIGYIKTQTATREMRVAPESEVGVVISE